MNYLIHPETLMFNAKSRIKGFSEMITHGSVQQHTLLELATEVAEEWTNDWDEDQGFGSSDGTYMLKEFIDNVISSIYIKNGMYMTKFTPTLSVVPYSEADHHEKIQRMENGV